MPNETFPHLVFANHPSSLDLSTLHLGELCTDERKGSGAENGDPFPMSSSFVWYNCESINGTLSLSPLVFLFFPLLLFPLPPFPFALLFPSFRPQIPEELTERIRGMSAFGGSKAFWLQGQQLCAGELWLRGRWV